MRRGLRWWGVAALAAALVSCTSSAAEQPEVDRAPTTAAAAPETPVVVKDCWFPAGPANVSLTGEQAQALTARAAELGRTTHSTGRQVQQLATTVTSTLAVDATTARTVAAGLAGLPRAARLVCAWARAAVEPQDPGPSGLVPQSPTAPRGLDRGLRLPARGRLRQRRGEHRSRRRLGALRGPRDRRVLPAASATASSTGAAGCSPSGCWRTPPTTRCCRSSTTTTSGRRGPPVLGWRDYVHPGATMRHRGNAVLRHLDHVHVAVESGRPFGVR